MNVATHFFFFLGKGQKRRMSVRESATIQTFPINFEFVGSMGSAYRQVGNAVPVLLSKLLGEKILDCLNMKS